MHASCSLDQNAASCFVVDASDEIVNRYCKLSVPTLRTTLSVSALTHLLAKERSDVAIGMCMTCTG
jgi:hypothetical protein